MSSSTEYTTLLEQVMELSETERLELSLKVIASLKKVVGGKRSKTPSVEGEEKPKRAQTANQLAWLDRIAHVRAIVQEVEPDFKYKPAMSLASYLKKNSAAWPNPSKEEVLEAYEKLDEILETSSKTSKTSKTSSELTDEEKKAKRSAAAKKAAETRKANKAAKEAAEAPKEEVEEDEEAEEEPEEEAEEEAEEEETFEHKGKTYKSRIVEDNRHLWDLESDEWLGVLNTKTGRINKSAGGVKFTEPKFD